MKCFSFLDLIHEAYFFLVVSKFVVEYGIFFLVHLRFFFGATGLRSFRVEEPGGRVEVLHVVFKGELLI